MTTTSAQRHCGEYANSQACAITFVAASGPSCVDRVDVRFVKQRALVAGRSVLQVLHAAHRPMAYQLLLVRNRSCSATRRAPRERSVGWLPADDSTWRRQLGA